MTGHASSRSRPDCRALAPHWLGSLTGSILEAPERSIPNRIRATPAVMMCWRTSGSTPNSSPSNRPNALVVRKNNDIKAPDGFLLGGLRRVRKDGIILFQRGWWQAPKEYAGELVWVHCCEGGAGDLEVAPPGYRSIYTAQLERNTTFCSRTPRPDAKPGVRQQWLKEYYERKR